MARNRAERDPRRRADSAHGDAPPRRSASPSRRVHFDGDPPRSRQDAAHPLENPPMLSHHQQSVEEPSMPEITPDEEESRDIYMTSLLTRLRDKIRALATSEFDFKIKGPIETAFINAPPELISYVGCIALGGPNGREGWRELIEHVNLRKALVFGIVSRVLHEHVLTSLCFGSNWPLIKKLKNMEEAQVNEDGFERSKARAEQIMKAGPAAMSEGIPIATARVALELRSLLQPIRDLNFKSTSSRADAVYTFKLFVLVNEAAHLNFLIRSCPDVIYHFAPVFKDEEFEPRRMHCENLRDMQKDCPLEVDDADGTTMPAPDPRGDPSDVALVRIVCSPGCVAYRKGGGALAKELLREEEERVDYSIPPELRSRVAKRKFYGREITAEDGIRSRTLTKSVVALRWGKPQFEDAEFAKSYKKFAEVRDEVMKIEEKKPTGCRMM